VSEPRIDVKILRTVAFHNILEDPIHLLPLLLLAHSAMVHRE
jgi:hypothetical protein